MRLTLVNRAPPFRCAVSAKSYSRVSPSLVGSPLEYPAARLHERAAVPARSGPSTGLTPAVIVHVAPVPLFSAAFDPMTTIGPPSQST